MAREHEAQRYETMIVFRSDLQEAGVKEQLDRLRRLLEANGASVGVAHEWGLRELAYDIQKERRGYYVIVEYTGSAAAVAELERTLKLSDAVLRFISVRQEHELTAVPAREDQDASAPSVPPLDDEDEEQLGAEAGETE